MGRMGKIKHRITAMCGAFMLGYSFKLVELEAKIAVGIIGAVLLVYSFCKLYSKKKAVECTSEP